MAAPRLMVGLDVGTTSSKAVVFDEGGRPVAEGRVPTTWTATRHGAELDPDDIIDGAVGAIAAAMERAPAGQVVGLGVASMGEAGILLDGEGRPVGPVIAWHDTRDDAELTALSRDIGPRRFSERTGLPFRHQWALTKHRWLMDHHPEARTAVRRLNVAEWVVRGLGGDEACEQSLASRTGWLDLASRSWWDEALEWSGATERLMPSIVQAGTALGSADGAGSVARLRGAVLTVAGHDHQVAAVGAGAVGEGDELDSCGTAEALVRSVAPGLEPGAVLALAEAGVTVGWHAMPGRWCLLGATTGGLTLQRVASALDLDFAALNALALVATGQVRVTTTDEGVSITGIREEVSPGAIWAAAVDSVTQDVATIHDAMTELSGEHGALVVTGGWSRNPVFMQARHTRFARVRTSAQREAGARGAALLGGLAAGTYAGPAEFPPPG